MPTSVPEKIMILIEDIREQGNVPLTRLTVLKSWFKQPRRLTAFGLWIARHAVSHKGKTAGAAGDLLNEARQLLGTANRKKSDFDQIERAAGRDWYTRAVAFQNQVRQVSWNQVRTIECWPLFLAEQGMAIHWGIRSTPSDGYKLAANWAQNYDPQYGNGLNGPSEGKLLELLRFLFSIEALEGFQTDVAAD